MKITNYNRGFFTFLSAFLLFIGSLTILIGWINHNNSYLTGGWLELIGAIYLIKKL